MTCWYHGGVPGLAVGDRLLPPEVTGTDHRLSRYVDANTPHGHRTDVVYLARYEQHARVYAALYPDGALYEVGDACGAEPDPDAPQFAVMVASAVITRVLRPRVVAAHRRLESWMRMLTTDPGRTST